ncbi:MAG: helix-turn-helix domain-containing protein [Rhizobacter sp.]|nr:helix-turn-helix domain-containing protein [Bacteriovorax sp.]
MSKKHNLTHLDTLHPMVSFGVVSGLTKQVRVTRLESRLNPAVPFPHKHNFYHIVIITKGKGWHEIDFKRHAVKAGSIFFMKPAQVHSWAMTKDTTGIVIEFEGLSMFAGDEAYHILSSALNPVQDYFFVKGVQKDEIISHCKNMLNEYVSEKKDFEIFLRLSLASLLLLFSRIQINKPAKRNRISKFREEFGELIEKNFRIHHDVGFYAKTLGITTKALTAKVNRVLGKSVRSLVQERCILESKRLLAYSDLSVSEISLELGFEDPNYFTRFFKLKTKVNPGKFRQKVRTLC